MSWTDAITSWALSKLLPANPTTVIATVATGKLTVGDVRKALSGIPALGIALSDIVHGTATLSDVTVLGEDALSVASLADPALAPVLGVAAALLPIVLSGIASGAIKGDPNPITDAQTTRNYQPGDPAARL
jgi:hypothetical protein